MNDKMKFVLRILWIALKLAVAIFAVFNATNVNILYQGF